MKRILFVFTILLLFCNSNLFANQDSSIVFIPKWTVGEEKEFIMSSSQLVILSDGPKVHVQEESHQTFSVVEKTDSDFLLKWKASGSYINLFAADPLVSGLMDTINQSYEPLNIQFRVDSVGKPTELVNYEEIQEFFITTLSDLEALLLDRGVTMQESKTLIDYQLKLVTNEEVFQKSIFNSIQTIFSIYNQSFKINPEPRKVVRKLPLLPREVSLTVNTTTEKPDPDTFIIQAKATVNDHEIGNTLLSPEQHQYFNQLETIPPEKKDEKNYAELSQYTINPVTGWLKEAKFHTALLIDGTYVEQLLILSLK